MDVEKLFSEFTDAMANGVEAIDGKKAWEQKQFKMSSGSFEITSFRGNWIEKASIGRIKLKVEKIIQGPGDKVSPMNLNSLQLNIFPSNPLLPVGLFNVENRMGIKGADKLGGYFSIFPMKDEEAITGNIKKLFFSKIKSHGKASSKLLKDYGELWQWLDWPYKGENGIGMKINAEENEVPFVKDMVMSVLKEYLDCISKLKDIDFNKEDGDVMFSFRYKLAEFVFMKDPSTKFCFEKGVPLDILTSMIFPPTVRF